MEPTPAPTQEPTPAPPPSVSGVEVTSNAGGDDTYALSDTIRITLTFSEAVNVTGSPQLKIDMDSAEWGEKWAEYESGGGTASLTFAHTVVEPNYSTQGIAVLANSLDLNGGTIRSTSSDTGADLSHLGLPHDSAHKVDWQQSTSEQPTSTPTPEPTPQPAPTAEPTPTPTPVPSVSGVEVTSDAGDDDTYALGNIVHITLTFSEKVYVTGSPQLAIDMDPAEWGEKPAAYISGSGTARLIFSYTVVEPNISTQGIAVLENSLDLNGGSIKSASSDTEAELSHVGLDHDARHKVDWQRTQPNRAPVVNTQSANYDRFTGNNNAPRGVLVSKPFYQVFTDPDGDELTFAVSIPEEHRRLVEELAVTLDKDFQPETRGWPQIGAYDRVFFQAADDAEWKAISPALPDPVPVTATLTATDPEGLSVSLDGDFLIHWESHPVLVKATASEQAIELTFDTAVEDDPTPKPGQFTVNVANADGTAGTVSVSNVSVSGNVVTLGLASGLATGQTVTVDYAHDADTPLKRDSEGGDHAASFTGQAVDMSLLNPPGQPQNFAVRVQRGQLDLSATWDAAEGATSYRLRWRQAGGEFAAANTVTVSGTEANFTVSAYGQWEVRLQACNGNGCAPEAGASEDGAPVVRLSLEPSQDGERQSRARSITPTPNPAADGNSYTAGWGAAVAPSPPQEQSQPDDARETRGIKGPSIAVGPRSSNPPDTTPPWLVRGEIDGDTMTFYFSEALDESATGSRFRVTLYFRNGWTNFTAHPSRVVVSGNKVVVHGLSRDGWPGWERAPVGWGVEAYYYKDDRVVPASQRLRDLAGNEVSTPRRSLGGHFPATRTIWVSNLTRPPALQSVTAHLDQLVLTFNKTLNEDSVPSGDAFTVTVNGSAVSLAATDPVAVSGATVTLTLASPLASADAVAVGYSRPSERPLRGLDGAVYSFPGGTNLVRVAPVVSQVKLTSSAGSDHTYAKGEVIRVTLSLSEAVTVTGTPRLKLDFRAGDGDEQWARFESGSGTATLVFAYTAAAGDDSQDGVAVVANSLQLNGGTIVAASDGDSALLAHTALASNPHHRVDSTPPTLARGAVSGVTLTLTFNENLGAAASLSNAQFSVFRTPQGGTEESIGLTGTPAISGVSVTLTLASAILDTDTDVKVSYTKPATGQNNRLIDIAGNETESFSSAPNLVGPAPTVSRVEVTSEAAADETYNSGESIRVTLTYSAAIDVDVTGGRPRLKIKLEPTSGERWADYAEGTGTTELVFAYTVAEPDSSTRGIAVLQSTLELNGGTMRATATQTDASLLNAGLGHDSDHKVDWQKRAAGAPWVTAVAITSDAGADRAYARGDVIRLTATFSEAVNVDTTSGTPRLKIRMAPYLWWMAPYYEGRSEIHPWLFSDHEERWADYSGGSGTSELTFDYTVLETNRSTQGVAVLEDGLELNGGAIRSTDATPIDAHLRHGGLWHDGNHRVDAVAPHLQDVTVAGTKLSVAFGEALDGDAAPPASAFTVKRTPQGGSEETVSLSGPPVIAGGAALLTLTDPVLGTDTNVKVSYSKPTASGDSKLRDLAGNEAASFTDQAVDATDTTPPRLLWGEIDGDVVTLYFSEALDETSLPTDIWEGDRFRMTLAHQRYRMRPNQCPQRGNYSFTPLWRELHVSGNTVVLVGLHHEEKRRPSIDWTIINFYYISDSAFGQRLRDLSGNLVDTPEPRRASTEGQTEIFNLVNVTWHPLPESATVSGARLTVTFDTLMDRGRVPAAGAFTVKVNGSAVSLAGSNHGSVSGRDLTLNLATAVASTDTVTVSYVRPKHRPLRNVVCERVLSFTDQAVTNATQ